MEKKNGELISDFFFWEMASETSWCENEKHFRLVILVGSEDTISHHPSQESSEEDR